MEKDEKREEGSHDVKKKESYLVVREGNDFRYSPVLMLDDFGSLREASHTKKAEILRLLSIRPMFAAEIGKMLGEKDQTVYYHLRSMERSGMVDVIERVQVRGVVAKRFAPRCLSIAASEGRIDKPLTDLILMKKGGRYPSYLRGFVKNDFFDAKFVIGSPDPHGEFKAYARDGHYATDLALHIGNFARIPDGFSVMLDVDIKSQKKQSENLIVVGGPVTNTFMREVNDIFKIRFSDDRPWGIKSTMTGNVYTDDSVGLIAKVKNPYNIDHSVLVVAGIRSIGTKAAVLALTRYWDRIVSKKGDGLDEDSWAVVVQGFDIDGDGRIDSVEILE